MQSVPKETMPRTEVERFLVKSDSNWRAANDAFVYVIRSSEGGPVKIGVAKTPLHRLELLQCGNPQELKIVGAAAVMGGASALLVEGEAHRLARFAHVRGEWFDLDTLEAMACVLVAAEKVGSEVISVDDLYEVYRQELREWNADFDAERRRKMRLSLGME